MGGVGGDGVGRAVCLGDDGYEIRHEPHHMAVYSQ
jgi:hypothetical protein